MTMHTLLVQELTRADFPLPNLASKLEDIRKNTMWGIGFNLIRGECA